MTGQGAEGAGRLVVVDGNNVMGSLANGWWRDRRGAARRLAEQLGGAQSAVGALVVFDGRGEDRSEGHVEVRHAGPISADDWIVARLRKEGPGGSPALVYTSDRGLRERVEALGHVTRPAGEVLREAGLLPAGRRGGGRGRRRQRHEARRAA